MIIRDALLDDIPQIVKVHKFAFPGFFLTTLGDRFLNLLYEGFLLNKNGILRVVIVGNNLVGFSAGTIAPEIFFTELRKVKWFGFLISAFPSLILNPSVVIKKLFNAVFYKGDTVDSLRGAALLSSIAVDPSCSGKSLGTSLLNDFEAQVKAISELEQVYLITDKTGNDRVVSFYLKSNYNQDSEFCQSGNRIMLRFVKNIKLRGCNVK